MTAMPVTERMTAEEYLARPEDPRERGWELISGELIDMTDASLPHELARMEILYALGVWSRAAPGRGLAIGAKKSGYERAGLPELWPSTSPGDVVLVLRRSRPDGPEFDVALELTRDDTLTSPLLPGFSVKLGPVLGE